MQPEHLYYAAMVAALALAPFNRVALVIVATFAIEQVAHGVMSLDTDRQKEVFAWAQVGTNSLAFICALAFTQRPGNAVAAVLFVPMAMVEVQEAVYLRFDGATGLHPFHVYWIMYWLAMAQLVAVLFGTDWQRMRITWTAYRRNQVIDRALRWLAC